MIANDYAFKTNLNLILISAESSQMIHSHTVSYSMLTQTLLRLKRRVTRPSPDSESILQSRHPHKSEVHKSETRRIWFSPKSFQGKLFHSKIFLFAHSKLWLKFLAWGKNRYYPRVLICEWKSDRWGYYDEWYRDDSSSSKMDLLFPLLQSRQGILLFRHKLKFLLYKKAIQNQRN